MMTDTPELGAGNANWYRERRTRGSRATGKRAPYKPRHVDPLYAAIQCYRGRIAVRLYAAGITVAEIADAFEVSRQTIYSLINDATGYQGKAKGLAGVAGPAAPTATPNSPSPATAPPSDSGLDLDGQGHGHGQGLGSDSSE